MTVSPTKTPLTHSYGTTQWRDTRVRLKPGAGYVAGRRQRGNNTRGNLTGLSFSFGGSMNEVVEIIKDYHMAWKKLHWQDKVLVVGGICAIVLGVYWEAM